MKKRKQRKLLKRLTQLEQAVRELSELHAEVCEDEFGPGSLDIRDPTKSDLMFR